MKTSDHLEIGQVYTRKQLREMFGIMDATINTGVFRPKGHNSVWLFVTEHKTPDRTQNADNLDGDILKWDGQTSGRTDPVIINHKQQGLELLVFYRKRKYEYPQAGFKFEGVFGYLSHQGNQPTHFTLKRATPPGKTSLISDLGSLLVEEGYLEGQKSQRFTGYYERNPKLRAAAILHHGTKCMVCNFDFEKVYGEHGAGYIEVHHLRPVSSLQELTKIDPKTDMAVVCSNCHRMIHRKKDKILSLEDWTLNNSIATEGEWLGHESCCFEP
jgi:5-methylcytosine-specific restriction protein A